MHETDDKNDMKIHISMYDTTDIVHKKGGNYESLKEVVKNLHATSVYAGEEKEQMNC